MIPSIHEIITGLLSGAYTREQAMARVRAKMEAAGG
jgi:hypothetical protein